MPKQSATFEASIVAGLLESLLEHGDLPVLVLHLISLENNSAFIFSGWVIFSKPCVFLDTDCKDPSYMVGFPFLAGLRRDLTPTAYLGLIPTACLSQSIPFLLESCFGFGVFLDLFLPNRPRHTGIDWPGVFRQTFLMRVVAFRSRHRRWSLVIRRSAMSTTIRVRDAGDTSRRCQSVSCASAHHEEWHCVFPFALGNPRPFVPSVLERLYSRCKNRHPVVSMCPYNCESIDRIHMTILVRCQRVRPRRHFPNPERRLQTQHQTDPGNGQNLLGLGLGCHQATAILQQPAPAGR